MSLDLFESDQRNQLEYAKNNSAPSLPSTFGQRFQADFNAGLLFSSSVGGLVSRQDAERELYDQYKTSTGEDLWQRFHQGKPSADKLEFLNNAINERKATDPAFPMQPITAEELNRKAIEKRQAARRESQELASRESTTGGAVGGFLGTLAAGITDPINVITFPLAAPRALGIVGTALSWAGIAGGTQTAIEIVGAQHREEAEPGYMASGEPIANVASAAGLGGVIGGGLKAAAAGWTRIKYGKQPTAAVVPPAQPGAAPDVVRTEPPFTGYMGPEDVAGLDRGIPVETVEPLGVVPEFPGSGFQFEVQNPWPRTIRDAGNVVESEANIAASNPFVAGSRLRTPTGKEVEIVGLEPDGVYRIKGDDGLEQRYDIRNGGEVLPATGTIEGEVAHRTALSKAMDDLIEGRPVEVDDIVGGMRLQDPRVEPVNRELSGLLGKFRETLPTADEARLAAVQAEGEELISKFEREVLRGRPKPAVETPQAEIPLERPVSDTELAATAEMGQNLNAKAVREARVDELTDDAVSLDFDRLRANKDFQFPDSDQLNPDGTPVMRSADDVATEFEKKMAMIEEIKGCATPPAEAAE